MSGTSKSYLEALRAVTEGIEPATPGAPPLEEQATTTANVGYDAANVFGANPIPDKTPDEFHQDALRGGDSHSYRGVLKMLGFSFEDEGTDALIDKLEKTPLLRYPRLPV